MTAGRARPPATLGKVLLDAHRRATAAGVGATALYLVRLTELAGLALTVAVQGARGGPDPAVLRERAKRAGVLAPVMAVAVAVEALALAIEGLAVIREADRRLLGWAVREVHRAGDVPVLVMLDGAAAVRPLSSISAHDPDAASFACSLPAIGDA